MSFLQKLAKRSLAIWTSPSGRIWDMPKDMVPQLVNGRWQKPRLSKRNTARIRKETLLAGQQWPFEEISNPPSKSSMKPAPVPKGRRRHYLKEKMKETIAKAMKEMPAREAEYKQWLKARRPDLTTMKGQLEFAGMR